MPRKLTPTQFQELVIDRIKAGETVKEIAARLNVDKSMLYRGLQRAGVSTMTDRYWAVTLHLPDDPGVLGYIAGMLDGEGCILHVKGIHWQVQIANTNVEVIDWLVAFGGTRQVSRRAHKPHHQDVWIWLVARRRDVAILLRAILPYMIVKRDRARMALDAIERTLQHFTPPSAA